MAYVDAVPDLETIVCTHVRGSFPSISRRVRETGSSVATYAADPSQRVAFRGLDIVYGKVFSR